MNLIAPEYPLWFSVWTRRRVQTTDLLLLLEKKRPLNRKISKRGADVIRAVLNSRLCAKFYENY